MSPLLCCFSQIKDPRRAEGLRTDLPQILSMVTLSYMAGYTGYRPVATFCQANEELLTQELGLTHPVPSHVTFRTVLNSLDKNALIAAFQRWMDGIDLPVGEVLAGDGKVLGSTVTDSQGSGQNYQAVVSLFSQQRGLVIQMDGYQNAKKGEAEGGLMRSLIKNIKGKGLLITLDALHAQKKRWTLLWNQLTTIYFKSKVIGPSYNKP